VLLQAVEREREAATDPVADTTPASPPEQAPADPWRDLPQIDGGDRHDG
jgi:hypothetical protein